MEEGMVARRERDRAVHLHHERHSALAVVAARPETRRRHVSSLGACDGERHSWQRRLVVSWANDRRRRTSAGVRVSTVSLSGSLADAKIRVMPLARGDKVLDVLRHQCDGASGTPLGSIASLWIDLESCDAYDDRVSLQILVCARNAS